MVRTWWVNLKQAQVFEFEGRNGNGGEVGGICKNCLQLRLLLRHNVNLQSIALALQWVGVGDDADDRMTSPDVTNIPSGPPS